LSACGRLRGPTRPWSPAPHPLRDAPQLRHQWVRADARDLPGQRLPPFRVSGQGPAPVEGRRTLYEQQMVRLQTAEKGRPAPS